MKRFFLISTVILVVFVVSGCMYREDEQTKHIPDEQQLEQVQQAINTYREDNNGILPIKNKENETDIYIKYLIDFKRLVPQYLAEIPQNAYENGGVFQYVLIDPENNPTVKIFDLRIAEMIREIQLRLSTMEYPPYKDVIDKNVFSLDFSELGYEEDPTVESPYTGEKLPFVITGEGVIYVDYKSDLAHYIQQTSELPFTSGEDIRKLLTNQSIFVPAYSLPYTIDEANNLIFMN